jgi:hypothetical protein
MLIKYLRVRISCQLKYYIEFLLKYFSFEHKCKIQLPIYIYTFNIKILITNEKH